MVEWIVKRAQGDRARVGTLAGMVCIVANVALCAAKGAIGVLSGSVSIVADAMNNLSDASSNIVSVLGFKLASKPADPEHPYGHGRYEYLSGLVVAALVLLIGVELVKSSVERVIHPEPVEFSLALVAVLVLSDGRKALDGRPSTKCSAIALSPRRCMRPRRIPRTRVLGHAPC